MRITMKKADVLAKLRERLKAAEAEDARAEKAHKAEEHAALITFRAKLRDALKWPYERAKKVGRYSGDSLDMEAPACPIRQAPFIAGTIRMVEMSTTDRFPVIDGVNGNDLNRALSWLPQAERVGQTVCD